MSRMNGNCLIIIHDPCMRFGLESNQRPHSPPNLYVVFSMGENCPGLMEKCSIYVLD